MIEADTAQQPLGRPEALLALERAFAGGGETGALMRTLDWSTTPCGPIATWSPGLRNAVISCLGMGMPTMILWGPEYAHLYNDAVIPVLRERHPGGMGRPLREAWPEVLNIVVPLIEVVLKTGRPVAFQDSKVIMRRNGRLESGYFTFSLSAIRDERGDIRGVQNTYIETTDRVLSQRRFRMLRELAVRTADARSTEEACRQAVEAIAFDRSDLLFGMIYLRDRQGGSASLVDALGLRPGDPAAPAQLHFDDNGGSAWPLGRVARSGQPELVTDVVQRFGELAEVGRAQPQSAIVLPAADFGAADPQAFVIVGLNPHRPLGEDYRGFLQLVAGTIGAAITNAHAHRSAQERAERLAEVDRAKTNFISDISHEFRTPLTLILGPVEELLAAKTLLSPGQRELLVGVRRSALLLRRMVNDILTFARIEIGRMEPFFEPIDLARLTREIAAMFDSSAKQAGLRLVVDCPSLPEPIFVDRELWEKIVLNLLSNALKFTLEGEITVSLRPRGDHIELRVRDTGVGVPAEDLPHLFERFYRVRGARARIPEGTGIGLSLSQELARVHGGAIRVESVEGQGSTFTVDIPRGSAHLPQDRIGKARPAAPSPPESTTYVEPMPAAAAAGATPSPTTVESRPRLLLVEDNLEMLHFLERIFADRYEVATATDGVTALASVSERVPDAILSDVMMPRLEGLELVSLLREDPRLGVIPIVLLSARAEEETALDGLSRGADDYVVKPFSVRELRARIDSHVVLARMRREVGELKLKDDFMTIVSHELVTPVTTLKLVMQLARDQMDRSGLPETTWARLERAIIRVETIVDDLLTLSVIQHGKLPLRTERCDLVQICRQASEEQTAATGRPIALDLPAEPLLALVDPESIAHVVASLLSNSLKFAATDRPVSLSLRSSDQEAIIAIRDEGPGIPAEELPRLFERFYRVPGVVVQTGSKVGLGLGLFISKQLVQRHGGRIWAESTVGVGSTFSFSLPLSPSQSDH